MRMTTQPESAENGAAACRPQWDADYRLQAFPSMGMFEEYLEMGVYCAVASMFNCTLQRMLAH